MKNREKERLKKQKYRAKLALMKNKTNNSTKSIKKKKNALRRQARKYGKTIAKLEDEKSFLKKFTENIKSCTFKKQVSSKPSNSGHFIPS